ncbi:cytochrome P450 [Stipitochalara longipes BDJ]|nr:cytochrome P450 [Stipitochalara longipes BDJ]
MAIGFSAIGISLLIVLSIRPLVLLTQNYLRIRSLGLPVVFSPFGRRNLFWTIAQQYLAPIFIKLSAIGGPFSIFNFIHYSANSCFFDSRYFLHKRYGPVFFIVTPGSTALVIADAPTADEVQTRRKDFVKNEAMYKPLNIYGRNVVTQNGEAWARHRRITTPPFNERNSSLVWKESLLQADGMLKSWITKSDEGVYTLPNDTMTLALNVLMAAGFGKRFEFGGSAKGEQKQDALSSYRNALSLVLKNLMRAIMTSMLMELPAWATPKKWLEMKNALEEVGTFFHKMVEDERAGLNEKSPERDNLMSALLRASDNEAMGKGKIGLSDDEIAGNLFIYNVAGHDTTSNTIAYAVALLSTDTTIQEWLREEIRSVFGQADSVEKWNYEKDFPRLKRCLALMYETLRLYGPVFYLPRYTAESYQTLSIQGRELVIPPQVHVFVNSATLHTLPSYWGDDYAVWRPSRWLDEKEELLQPSPGMFNPWTHGPRVCPGKKFAQVEFVAVIAKLLKNGNVKPKLKANEKLDDAIVRVKEVVQDSALDITLNMKHPERAPLIWEKLG